MSEDAISRMSQDQLMEAMRILARSYPVAVGKAIDSARFRYPIMSSPAFIDTDSTQERLRKGTI